MIQVISNYFIIQISEDENLNFVILNLNIGPKRNQNSKLENVTTIGPLHDS